MDKSALTSFFSGTVVARTSLSLTGELSLSCTRPRPIQLSDDHLAYVGKPSAVGQPTRPTQPFILLGSINE